jgi:hypothetical protein
MSSSVPARIFGSTSLSFFSVCGHTVGLSKSNDASKRQYEPLHRLRRARVVELAAV